MEDGHQSDLCEFIMELEPETIIYCLTLTWIFLLLPSVNQYSCFFWVNTPFDFCHNPPLQHIQKTQTRSEGSEGWMGANVWPCGYIEHNDAGNDGGKGN